LNDNGIASILKIIGIIQIIGGTFIGLIVGIETIFTNFIFITSSSVTAGFLFIGFGEIINLLEGNSQQNRSIEDKLTKISNQLETFQPVQEHQQEEELQHEEESEEMNAHFNAPTSIALAIKSHYPKQWTGLQSVKQTPIENYYVAVYDEDYEVVRYDGDRVRLIESFDKNLEDIQQWVKENWHDF